jgi:nitronate monooxygenase
MLGSHELARRQSLSPQTLLALLDIELPIVQAPMAGVSSPAMAAAVGNAGALGSIGVGATNVAGARKMIAEIRERSNRPFNVNVFCHQPARSAPVVEAAWIDRLRPEFNRLGAAPPTALTEIYKSFVEDDDMLAALLADKPKVVSFHFGAPSSDRVQALRNAGIVLLGSATSVDEARILVAAGGGIMDGASVSAALRLGASAGQLGTAFIACPESQADAGYRAALMSAAANHTVMTRAISGRPARCLANRFTAFGAAIPAHEIPAYPIAYDAGKALNAAGKSAGEPGFGAQWAGQGAPLARSLPAADLVAALAAEMKAA